MAHLPVPDLWPGVVAFRTAEGPRDPAYVVPAARVVVPSRHRWSSSDRSERVETSVETAHQDLWRAAGFEGPGRPLRVVEGRPALRWAIDIAAPLAPRGRRWGDDPFARSLAAALERLGQWVTVDHPETRARASRDHDDVVLVIRGLEPVAPTAADAGVAARLLWVISHPAEVSAEECAPYDVVLAASHRVGRRPRDGVGARGPAAAPVHRRHPLPPRPRRAGHRPGGALRGQLPGRPSARS